jgi:hypothetical protein
VKIQTQEFWGRGGFREKYERGGDSKTKRKEIWGEEREKKKIKEKGKRKKEKKKKRKNKNKNKNKNMR